MNWCSRPSWIWALSQLVHQHSDVCVHDRVQIKIHGIVYIQDIVKQEPGVILGHVDIPMPYSPKRKNIFFTALPGFLPCFRVKTPVESFLRKQGEGKLTRREMRRGVFSSGTLMSSLHASQLFRTILLFNSESNALCSPFSAGIAPKRLRNNLPVFECQLCQASWEYAFHRLERRKCPLLNLNANRFCLHALLQSCSHYCV